MPHPAAAASEAAVALEICRHVADLLNSSPCHSACACKHFYKLAIAVRLSLTCKQNLLMMAAVEVSSASVTLIRRSQA